MILPSDLEQLKQVSIVEYLASQGLQPTDNQGHELTYYSPFRSERTPSFRVNITKNVFKDFGDDDVKGDIIRLVQLFRKCDFLSAVNELKQYSNQTCQSYFSFSSNNKSIEADTNSVEIVEVKPLQHPALINYCRQRGISYNTAFHYLKQVHYKSQGGHYFALGFANSKGGYELRAKVGRDVKLCTNKALTVFEVPEAKGANVFEGFFDFLSALEYYQVKKPSQTTIVLNSTSLIKQAIPLLKQYRQVNTYLDNDEAGIKALTQLKSNLSNVSDRSNLYLNHSDFNDFWRHRKQIAS